MGEGLRRARAAARQSIEPVNPAPTEFDLALIGERDRLREALATLSQASAEVVMWHGLHDKNPPRGTDHAWRKEMDARLYRLHVALAAAQKEDAR